MARGPGRGIVSNVGATVGIFGGGYVGLVTAVGLADLGSPTLVYEPEPTRHAELARGELPIHEPGLSARWNRHWGRTIRLGDVHAAPPSIYFICMGTPPRDDGSVDLTFVEGAARDIAAMIRGRDDFPVVVVKSTVPPGTTEHAVLPILEEGSGGTAGRDFGVAANPEFLREGTAVEDFFHPDRIVLGVLDPRTEAILRDLYTPLPGARMTTDPRTAEMIKYASNAFLAARVSLANELGNVCKGLGIDAYRVMEGVGLDPRIGPRFLEAGLGFGGSCFSKDVRALEAMARASGVEPRILAATLGVNEGQPGRMLDLLRSRLGDLRGRRIAVLGLAFKADTDDVRGSRAIPLLKGLLEAGATVTAYDPRASKAMANLVPSAEYRETAAEALRGADACLVATAWGEFASLGPEFGAMKRPLVIDGRHALDPRGKGIEYEGLCW